MIGLIRKGEKIDHQPGEHDDYANAAAGVVDLVKPGRPTPRIRTFESDGFRPNGSMNFYEPGPLERRLPGEISHGTVEPQNRHGYRRTVDCRQVLLTVRCSLANWHGCRRRPGPE